MTSIKKLWKQAKGRKKNAHTIIAYMHWRSLASVLHNVQYILDGSHTFFPFLPCLFP